jgi:phosphatidylserine decarboxylase
MVWCILSSQLFILPLTGVTVIIADYSEKFIAKQITMALAQPIVCRTSPDKRLAQDQPYGFISFGSRIDLLLPAAAEIAVQGKDVVRGGETIVAFLKEPSGA